MKNKNYRRQIVMCLWVMVALTGATYAQRTRIVSLPNEPIEQETLFMNTGDNERGLQVSLKGKVEFTEDYRDVETLSRNGFVKLRETRGAQIRRLEVEADKDGALMRAYFVNDAAQAFDRDAHQWLAEVMLETVRQGGYDAERRVTHLYKQGGANAVLDVIPLLKDDFGKRLYFQLLLLQHPLEAAQMPRVIKQISRDIVSAYEKRLAFNAVPKVYWRDAAILNQLIAAALTLDSNYEREQMLLSYVQGADLTDEQVNLALKIITGLPSAYDKAEALISLHNNQTLTPAMQPAFFNIVNGMHSPYEQARVLTEMLKGKTSPATLKLAIQAAAFVSSDFELAGVLLRAAALSRDDAEICQLITATSKNIRSEYDRGRVLAATLR